MLGLSSLRCPSCVSDEELSWNGRVGRCRRGHSVEIDDGIVQYTARLDVGEQHEADTRDRQAAGYLQHPKFPAQIVHLAEFLDAEPRDGLIAYDLGCGPGPFTATLAARGQRVVAVDFSPRSLEINRDSLDPVLRPNVTFVRADLNRLRMQPSSADLLLMCDFLQHLGDRTARTAFLRKALAWLRPGGRFYLTFFNINLKNRLKRDLRGAFSDGSIRYERLSPREVLAALPERLEIERVTPLNIAQSAAVDRLMSRMPGAPLLARMMAVAGRRV